MGFCGAIPGVLRVPRPRGFNERALELFFGGGMSKKKNTQIYFFTRE